MRIVIKMVVESAAGKAIEEEIIRFDRDSLNVPAKEGFGLTLGEGKQLLHGPQVAIVSAQAGVMAHLCKKCR